MRPFLLLATLLVASGCGTIVNGSNQDVSFVSTPIGATVTVDGMDLGATPTIVSLSRKSTHTVAFSLDGYQPQSMIINRSVSGWAFGNILFGGLIGLVVDLSTGGMYKLTPDQVQMALGEMAAAGDPDTLTIAVVLEPQAGWEKIGQLTPTP